MDAAEDLLTFWFGGLTDGFADDAHRRLWFLGGEAFDETCRIRFASLAAQAASGELDEWQAEPRSCLAFILLCDQIPRNIHRGRPLAFATDGPALNAARTGVESGLDRVLDYDERAFFYLPFEHSESLLDQHTCVGLFAHLCDETPEGFRHHTGDTLRYAHLHRDIIEHYGRFPHRNAVLGRDSTPEEVAFLEKGNDFGQSESSGVRRN